MMIVLIIVGAIVFLNVISFVINKVLSRNELSSVKPTGKLVEVNGKHMHITSMGTGEQTIVLLPGLGIPLPSVDYRPFMQELAEKYTVVCVEYFGYGFSDGTSTPRTNANYVEETRQALTLAGFKPPYILMPYSASGIYAEYHATKYPQEVEALIMLDTTSSAEKSPNVPRFVFILSKISQAIGMMRFLNPILIPKFMGLNAKNGYGPTEISDFMKFSNHSLNDTIINQNIHFSDNTIEIMAMDFPAEVPVLAIKADTYKKGTWKKYMTDHMKKLGTHAQCKVIPGSTHGSIYHDLGHRTAVREAIEEFLHPKK